MTIKKDNIYMHRCLQLAQRGKGNTQTNPCVGACLVHENKIIGEGWHKGFGNDHAEVMAILAVKHPSQLRTSTLYVTLEPCNHHGKTPPCTDLIIQSGIQKVVVGCLDPNPLVAGKGIDKLKEAGIEVIVNVEHARCMELIRPFRISIRHRRPYIILKWAASAEGFTGIKDQQVGLSNSYSNLLVHKWRSEIDAIMVSSRTLKIDNPLLTTRHVKGKSPIVVIIDRNGQIDPNQAIFSTLNPKIIFTSNPTKYEHIDQVEAIEIQSTFDSSDFKDIMQTLYSKNIGSIMIEGGSTFHQLWIKENLWDEICVIKTNVRLQDGIQAPEIPDSATLSSVTHLKTDQLVTYINSE